MRPKSRDKDGVAASANSPPPGVFGGAEGGGLVLPATADTTFVQHYNTSLVSTGDVRVLRAATVVVDVTRTDGLPLAAVASYAAMVAFAEIRPGAAPPDSVLGLFAGGPVRREPSVWDLAFLRALYRLPLDRRRRGSGACWSAALSPGIEPHRTGRRSAATPPSPFACRRATSAAVCGLTKMAVTSG